MRAVQEADLALCVHDGTTPLCASLAATAPARPCRCTAALHKTIAVINKADLAPGIAVAAAATMPVHRLSCRTRQGYPEFLAALTDAVRTLCTHAQAESGVVTNTRHRAHIQVGCATSGHFPLLTRRRAAWQPSSAPWCARPAIWQTDDSLQRMQDDVVVMAEELRLALSELGRITGHATVDHILDVIFRDFCIGK